MKIQTARTAKGIEFLCPETKDVLVTLFTSKEPYSAFETIVMGIVLFQIVLFFFAPVPPFVFLLLFVFWRIAYNGLLGILLRKQSTTNFVVNWCQKHGFDSNCKTRTSFTNYLIDQIKIKMGSRYDYEAYPLEFNAWILFRGLVDIILVNDVASFIIFCFAYSENNTLEAFDVCRIFSGVA